MMIRHPFYSRKCTKKMQLLLRIAFFQCVFLRKKDADPEWNGILWDDDM